jgi:hypothetical protein
MRRALNGAICGCSIDNETRKIDRVGMRQENVAMLIAYMLQIREPELREYGRGRSGRAVLTLRRRQHPACSLIKITAEGSCDYPAHRFYPN